MGHRVDWRITGDRTVGEDPARFATALEMLAVKVFGDMGGRPNYV